MNHRIIIIESILRQERHLMAQSEIVKLETELQQLKQGEIMLKLEEPRQCNACNKADEYENMCLDLLEILECSNERIEQWENENPNICLQDWFCDSCATKYIAEIEELNQ
mgnify:FL=1|jgi:hypothetical protein